MEYPKRSRLVSLAWKEVVSIQFLGRPFEEFHRDLKHVQARYETKMLHNLALMHDLKRLIYDRMFAVALGNRVPFDVIEADLEDWINIGFGNPVKEASILYAGIRMYRNEIGHKELARIYRRLNRMLDVHQWTLSDTLDLMKEHGPP
jgi:hypothetical protein